MATITRSIKGEGGVTKSGNAALFPIEPDSSSFPPTFTWDEVSEDPDASLPRIVDQVFHIDWPAITGTTDNYASFYLYMSINNISIDMHNIGSRVGGEDFGVQMRIEDEQGTRANLPYSPETQDWVRIEQDAEVTNVSLGPDGVNWTIVASNARYSGVQIERFILLFSFARYSGEPLLPDSATAKVDNWAPALPPFGETRYDPDNAPKKEGKGCQTLLDFIREFSSQVRQPVRITGPATIEMVDLSEPLAGTLVASDGDEMYYQASQQLTASDVSLASLKGRLALSMGAEIITNDFRIPNSGWRIPERLPVYDLAPAAVQRVSFTFTPETFTGTVEFRAATVPLTVRR